MRRGREITMKEKVRKRILEAVDMIPKRYLSDAVIRDTIRCVLYGFLKEQGMTPIPSFRNPRFPEGPVDMAGMADDQTVAVAFCSNPTIELDAVKSLERVACERRIVISFSRNEKKVQMSTFFLKPGIEHIYIYEKKDK